MSLYRTLSKMNGFLYNRSLLFKKGPSEEWKSLKFRCKKKFLSTSLNPPPTTYMQVCRIPKLWFSEHTKYCCVKIVKNIVISLRCYIFLGLSKVEKQLHIEGNHFLFSFHAMHLRQKTKPRKVAHILLVARPRRPLYHQASVRLKPLFLKNATEMKHC